MTSTMLPHRTLAIGIAIGTVALCSCANSRQPKPTGTLDPAVSQPAPRPVKRKPTSDYPLATLLPDSNTRVISPYKPHNVIEVKGFRSGQLARDPSTAPIDPTTGKPDINQAQIFELP